MGSPAPLGPQVPLQLPVKLLPVLKPKRFKVLYGGRGGAKSHTVAQLLIMLSMQRKLRILCVREVQKSLKQSSMQVLKDYIERMGLGRYFDCLVSEIRCLSTGSTFEFTGLKDHTKDSIKSFEGCDIVWVEEAHSVSANSWNTLIPTIRKAGSEIWITFNPDQETDYVYDRFVAHDDPDAIVIKIDWRDNPWFGGEMDTERRKLKALNDDLYNHVWEGKPRSLAGLLFKRHWFKRFELGQEPRQLNKYLSSDYAGEPDEENPEAEPDWTEHGIIGVDPNEHLWVTDWWSGQESPDTWIDAWLALIRLHKPLMAFEEKGVILRTLNGRINQRMRQSGTFIHREGLASSGSKYDRALAFAAMAATGIVHIPNTEWGDRLINQLCAFNGRDGRVDDMVDVLSKFAQGLDEVVAAQKPVSKAKHTQDDKKPNSPAPFTDAYYREREQREQRDEAEQARYYR